MTNAAAQDLPKKAVNLTVRADLLAQARHFGVNLSATLEAALQALVKDHQREQWKIQHQAAIEAYNAQVDELGVFSDGLRGF
jgi:antitoxin CcdA